MLATQPNMNPPVITTGIGPHGHKIVYTQPPEGMSTTDTTPSDDNSTGSSGVFDAAPLAAPDVQHQYRTLLEAMAAAAHASDEEVGAAAVPAVATHSEPATNKENAIPVIPPSTPHNTSSSSSYVKAMIAKAKSNIKKLPPKLTLEETLIKLSTFVISSLYQIRADLIAL